MVILPTVILGSTQKGPEQWCKFLFPKKFERTNPEKYEMFNHCIWWQSMGRAWNVQNGLEAEGPSLSPEGDRQKGLGPSERYPKLCYNLFLIDANFDGGSREPSDSVLLKVYLCPEEFYGHIRAARLMCRIRHCWKFGTSWPWRWPCPCCTACDSSRIHCRALHVDISAFHLDYV